jgi:hypothetical protein
MKIKPTLFDLNWYWYEESSNHLFTHDNKTEAQFKKDVKSMLKKYGKEFIKKNKDTYIGAYDWISFVAEKMPELGYKPVTPTTFSFFGGYILKGEGEDNIAWKKIVGKELFDEAVAINKKIQDKMFKRIKDK